MSGWRLTLFLRRALLRDGEQFFATDQVCQKSTPSIWTYSCAANSHILPYCFLRSTIRVTVSTGHSINTLGYHLLRVRDEFHLCQQSGSLGCFRAPHPRTTSCRVRCSPSPSSPPSPKYSYLRGAREAMGQARLLFTARASEWQLPPSHENTHTLLNFFILCRSFAHAPLSFTSWRNTS